MARRAASDVVMRDILARRNALVLRTHVADRTLFAFDYDGTLAPLVSHPDLARMRQTTRRLLTRLASLTRCAVLTGRRRADVRRHLQGIPLTAIIGNHGAETGRGPTRSARVSAWHDALATALDWPGVWVENKGLSIAVHYHSAPHPAAARRVIWQAASRLRGARVFDGAAVLNVVPRGVPNKGGALDALRRRLGCDRVVFVGDDQTDEDAFRLAAASAVFAVRIGRSRSSSALYFIRDQRCIDTLLARMIALIAGGAAPSEHDHTKDLSPRRRWSVPP